MAIKKIIFMLGSRANYSSIKSVISEFKKDKFFKVYIILFSSSVLDRYGQLSNILKKDQFDVDYFIYNQVEGENPLTMAKSTGLALIEISTAFQNCKPDLVFTVGDRYETMATVLASSYMNIPLAHTMGGEVTGTIDESIRHAVTKFSHIHFPASKIAARRIKKLGEIDKLIFNVGCPRIDIIKQKLSKNNILPISLLNKKVFQEGVGKKFNLKERFVIVSQHPVTTEYKYNEKNILMTLGAVKNININALVLWPNSDAGSDLTSRGIRKFREKNPNLNFFYVKNLHVDLYINLLNITSCLVGNSSSGIREGAYIGVPCVNIGSRQNKRERSMNVIDCNFTIPDIMNSIKKQIKRKKYKSSSLYGDGNAAKKIVKIIKKLKTLDIQKTISY